MDTCSIIHGYKGSQSSQILLYRVIMTMFKSCLLFRYLFYFCHLRDYWSFVFDTSLVSLRLFLISKLN